MSQKKRTREEINKTLTAYGSTYANIEHDLSSAMTENLRFLNALDRDRDNTSRSNRVYTYSRIGTYCGTSYESVRTWFNRKKDILPKVQYIYLLAKLYNVNIDYLFAKHNYGEAGSDHILPTYDALLREYIAYNEKVYGQITACRLVQEYTLLDPILNHLVKEFYKMLDQVHENMLLQSTLDKWQREVDLDFHIICHTDMPEPLIKNRYDLFRKKFTTDHAAYLATARHLDVNYKKYVPFIKEWNEALEQLKTESDGEQYSALAELILKMDSSSVFADLPDIS